MSDKLLQLFHKHDRYKFSKPNMARNLSDFFPVEPAKLFNVEKVENLVNEIIDSEVDDSFTYNSNACPQLCMSLTEQVRKAVKELDFKRYKLVCMAQIFERRNQGIYSVARFFGDPERDRYVVVRRENNHAYISVSVFGLYYP